MREGTCFVRYVSVGVCVSVSSYIVEIPCQGLNVLSVNSIPECSNNSSMTVTLDIGFQPVTLCTDLKSPGPEKANLRHSIPFISWDRDFDGWWDCQNVIVCVKS